MREITGSQPLTYRNTAERRLGSLKAELAYTDVDTIVSRGLHQFIDDLQSKINSIGEGIHNTFFAMRTIDNTQSQTQSPNQPQSQTQTQKQG